MDQNTITELECTHCHQAVNEIIYGSNRQKVYCCYGCKVVDELLHEKRGIPEPDKLATSAYAYLDETKIRSKLLSFEEENFARVNLHLPAIHCSSCIYLLESLPDVEEAILEVQVHFGRKEATLTFRSDRIRLSQLAALLDYIGYTPDFQTRLGKDPAKRNTLLIQLGIAGFFFGNTMLLALPEYLHSSLASDPALQRFFRYLMLLFSLPVITYSAKDYFLNTLKTLRAGILSIDLPIVLGILVLFIRSVYEVISQSGAGYFDSLTGLIFFLLIGKWYQQKTYANFSFDRDFRSFLPLAANLQMSNGRERAIAVDDLKPGDIIMVRQGEIVPADAKLLSEQARADYSYITGESIPVHKKTGETIFAGARIQGSAARMEVKTSVNRSYLSSLWNRDSFTHTEHKKGSSLTDRISRYFTPAIIAIACLAALLWSFFDTSKAVTVFTAVLIVACPCALALAEPFASGSMMRWFGRHGFYLKSSDVLNRMAAINRIVFDKTGTLTRQNNIHVKWKGIQLSKEQKTAIASIALNAQHPLAPPLLAFLNTNNAEAGVAADFSESSGEGVSARVNETAYRMGKAAYLNLQDEAQTTAVYVEANGILLGYFSFFQETRKETARVLTKLQNKYEVSLLSGDNEAERIRFEKLLGSHATLLFNQSPHHKLEYLHGLQFKGQKVAMIGDGLNDAGALQQSEVGISLCEKNVNFFPASDALLLADSFGKLDKFMQLSRMNQKVIYKAFTLSLLYNLVGLSFAIAGVLSPLVCAILMPVSSVSVVIFTTLASRYQAERLLKGLKWTSLQTQLSTN